MAWLERLGYSGELAKHGTKRPLLAAFFIVNLATIFEARMLALVAVFVIIVAILFCNRFPCKFSCHEIIIAQSRIDVNLTKKHKCDIMER